MTLRANTIGRLLLPAAMLMILFFVSRSNGVAQTPAAQAPIANACPGQPMPSSDGVSRHGAGHS